MKHLLTYAIIFSLVCFAVGCFALGTASQATMMQKWQGQEKDLELLADVNSWANWYAQGEKQYPVQYANEENLADFQPEKGKCQDQTELKLAILKQLNIPAKRMHCVINRDPYNPVGHAFVVATLNGKDYIMDNGTVQDVVWELDEALAATYGVEQLEEW